jgi:hypothetical protein
MQTPDPIACAARPRGHRDRNRLLEIRTKLRFSAGARRQPLRSCLNVREHGFTTLRMTRSITFALDDHGLAGWRDRCSTEETIAIFWSPFIFSGLLLFMSGSAHQCQIYSTRDVLEQAQASMQPITAQDVEPDALGGIRFHLKCRMQCTRS